MIVNNSEIDKWIKYTHNRVNKITTLNSIYLEIILHYITFTFYYIVKDTFRSQVITAV